MLHRGVLPAHRKWSSTLRRLAYVVVDECHAYRGVFGSHVGHVLRRLRRICRRYGAEPVFLLASATVAEPAEAATRLVGAPVVAVTEDGSPRPGATFALWEPPLTRSEEPRLNSSHANISYAVFCLKKKLQRIHIYITDN